MSGFASDFEEDAFAVEEQVGEEAEGDKGEGESDGGDFGRVAMGEDVEIDPVPCGDGLSGVIDFDPEHDFDDEVGEDRRRRWRWSRRRARGR